MDITNIFPQKTLGQGDTWSIPLTLSHYNPENWTVTYIFQRAGQENILVTSTAGTFVMAAAAATTLTFPPGTYTVVAQIASLAERYTLGNTEITITPDPTLSSGGDPRSINRKALDDVEAALAAGAGSDVIEYTVAGTIIKKDRAGLLALRAYYLGQVRAEQGKPSIGTILNYL